MSIGINASFRREIYCPLCEKEMSRHLAVMCADTINGGYFNVRFS